MLLGIYVSLSHLRSKELQRIHKPCIPRHRDASKCTPVYIQMYPGKCQKDKPLSSKYVVFVAVQTENLQIVEMPTLRKTRL